MSAAGNVTGTITVAARSVHTKNKRRDEHLPGPQRGPPDPGLPAGRTLAPLDEKVDHVRGSPAGRLIIEYGDYECPYSRQAFHSIEQVERRLGGNVRFAFRHFPLTRIHLHALAAASAAEAAARQGRFWDMHELLFHRQKALEDGGLRSYAAQLSLDVAAFDRDRASAAVLERIQRDVGQRPGLGPSARHSHPVHRPRRAPRRLRPARPAGGTGHFRVIRSRGAP